MVLLDQQVGLLALQRLYSGLGGRDVPLNEQLLLPGLLEVPLVVHCHGALAVDCALTLSFLLSQACQLSL